MIETERLMIKPFTVPMMKAALQGTDALQKVINVHVEAGYPAEDYLAMFPVKLKYFSANPAALTFECFVILKATNTIIADIGFKGGPDATGSMDMGYSVMPAYRGQGIATEMVRAMTMWGKKQPGVKKLTADCDKTNHASRAVLLNAGYHCTSEDATRFYFETVSLY